MAKIVQDYLNRWKVEEYIRFIKQQYNAERFQVLSLGRIKNFFHLLYMAKDEVSLYSLADGLAEVLRISPKRVKQIWVRRPNPYQLSLFDSRTII